MSTQDDRNARRKRIEIRKEEIDQTLPQDKRYLSQRQIDIRKRSLELAYWHATKTLRFHADKMGIQ